MAGQLKLNIAGYAGQRISGQMFLPAPLGGLNTVDAHGVMDAKYAYDIVNFWPMANGLMVRGGSAPFTGTFAYNIGTIMAYTAPADDIMFAAADGQLFRIDTNEEGDHIPTSVASGIGSIFYQFVNFSNLGGSFLWACNGVDAPIYYDGEVWEHSVIQASEAAREQGYKLGNITNVAVYQQRLYLLEENSMILWYLGMDSIQGDASPLPLGSYFNRGGHLMLVGNITADGGEGPDDYLFIVTSEGEAISFRGGNPDSAETWAMTGRFQIARPLGLRSMCKYGGDLIILTDAGIAGVSSMLASETPGLTGSATEKIQPYWAALARGKQYMPGWQVIVYHRRGLIFVNVPKGNDEYFQLVYNPTTGAWSKIEGWNTTCLLEYEGDLMGAFFGLPQGSVKTLDTGYNDQVLVDYNGAEWDVSEWEASWWGGYFEERNVRAYFRQAFVEPTKKSVGQKQYTMLRPYISASVQPGVDVGIAIDNNIDSVITMPIYDIGTESNAHSHSYARWCNVLGTGYSVSVCSDIESGSEDVLYAGSDLQYIAGNGL